MNPCSIQWLPAQFLGQAAVDAQLRPWLIGSGLLTVRMSTLQSAGAFSLRLVDQWTGLLDAEQKAALKSSDNAALFRDVELILGQTVWVFARTVIPDSTLCAHPWLAELGDSPLCETLHDLSGVERSAYQYAWLPAADAASAHALRNAIRKPAGLWARRSRSALRAAPLLTLELFLPAAGRP